MGGGCKNNDDLARKFVNVCKSDKMGVSSLSRIRIQRVLGIALAALFICFSGIAGAQQRTELHFLASGFSAELVALLEDELLPAFEAEHNVNVLVDPIGWGERSDRIAILIASGIPPDVIGTGFYSPYQEGGSGLLAPLDRYVAEWEHKSSIPQPVWDTQTWRGSIVAVPIRFDLRAIAYHKNVFAESGFDPNRPPQSWEELIDAARQMTRFTSAGDRLEVRGMAFADPAQEMLSYIHQAGIPPVDLETFQSNLNTPQALEAARTFVELNRVSRRDLGTSGGGFVDGGIAMQSINPTMVQQWSAIFEGSLSSHMGIFSPRRSLSDDPVALGFINGVAIAEASRNKDLAWKFIEFLISDEVLTKIQALSGWMTTRVDLAAQMDFEYLDMYYPQVPFIRPAQLPPPRDRSQNELSQLMTQAINGEIAPEQAMSQAHELWARLLQEWRSEL